MDTLLARAPGRINLIGEHTDYNGGFVMPAAIDREMLMEIRKSEHPNRCVLYARNLDESYSFELSNVQPVPNGGWRNHLLGVVSELQQIAAPLEGFEASFEGTIPIGGGMSSSAALECSFGVAINELFRLGLSNMQLIRAAQLAEHRFVGIKCGIMDMFASVMGRKDHVLLLDCRSLEYEYLPLALGDFQIVLLNSKVSHALADSAYNDRRSACEEGVALLQRVFPVESLRDISLEQLESTKDWLPPNIYNRCLHVISENMRVLVAKKALQNSNLQLLGQQLYASHTSLQFLYEVSCPELDFLVERAKQSAAVLGSRMMGGGFGGCTINLVRREEVDAFVEITSKAYRDQFSIDLEPYLVSIEDGAGVIP